MKHKQYLTFLIFILCLTWATSSLGLEFTFDKGQEGWNTWGTGEGRHISALGNNSPGCILLQGGPADQVTMHQKVKLPPGRYMVTANIRALELLPGKYGESLLLFYRTDKEITGVVKDITGTFNWKKVSYSIEVTRGKADIWFRLKSSGQVWIDDISFTPYDGKKVPYHLGTEVSPFPKPNKVGDGVRCTSCYRWTDSSRKHCPICGEPVLTSKHNHTGKHTTAPDKKMLLDFEKQARKKEEKYHYIKRYDDSFASSGESSAIISYGRYNNLQLKPKIRDWSGYDYLNLDIYNPVMEQLRFAVAIGDKRSTNYWQQLNHYSTLMPGWNQLRFQIQRFVGERGSIRHHRYLDLNRIEKVWFAVEPEGKKPITEKFRVDNIHLSKAPSPPTPFPGLLLFDFVKESFRTQPGFIGITTRNNYTKDVGFGFIDAKFWRAHDSIYADTLHRDGIFINRGTFKIDLPNGDYIVRLVPSALGEWYEHFWMKRKITLQNKPALLNNRPDVKHYLKDLLRFQDVEPTPDDHPYDLYLSKLFTPVEKQVTVKNGSLKLSFEGDDSGIMLNSLIIYPATKKQQGEQFLADLSLVLKDEFDGLCRKITPTPIEEKGAIEAEDSQRGYMVSLINSNHHLRYNHILKSEGKEINLEGGRLDRPVQALAIRNFQQPGILSIHATPLQTEDGTILPVQPGWIRYGVAQYQSHTYNHETYELAPRFLRNFPAEGLELSTDYSLLLWYQIPLTQDLKPGSYSGSLTLKLHEKTVQLPVSLEILDFTLPEVNIAAGFFGLDPIGFDWFKGKGVSKTKKDYRYKVLQELRSRGFTTWSSLPPAKFSHHGNTIKLEAGEIDELMQIARDFGFKHEVFTYGRSLPVVLDKYGSIKGMSQEQYRTTTASLLKERIEKNNWLPVVYSISDEASGYSQKVDRDLKRAKMLKQYFPFLRYGGFSHPIEDSESYGYELNLSFTDLSLSSQTDSYTTLLKQHDVTWGLYNQAVGPFNNSRASFGDNLYKAVKAGAEHQLGWHLTLSQNYPYYDLDGREHDAMMLFPKKDGTFDYGLKFEWATLGLRDYRMWLLNEQTPPQ